MQIKLVTLLSIFSSPTKALMQKHLASSFLSSTLVIHSFNSTASTLDWKILSWFCCRLNWLFIQILLSFLCAARASPSLAWISFSVPPDLLTVCTQVHKTSSTSSSSTCTFSLLVAFKLRSFVFLELIFSPVASLLVPVGDLGEGPQGPGPYFG